MVNIFQLRKPKNKSTATPKNRCDGHVVHQQSHLPTTLTASTTNSSGSTEVELSGATTQNVKIKASEVADGIAACNIGTSTEMDELIRFGVAFGVRRRTDTPSPTPRIITDLSEEAQRHYQNFQKWKEQHSKFLSRRDHQYITNTTSTNTTDRPQTGQHDEIDALEWQNAFDYSIRYHSSNIHHEKGDEVHNIQLDAPTPHFRIIVAPQCATTQAPHTTVMMTKAPVEHGTPSIPSHSRILYVLPAGMNISSLPPVIASLPTTDPLRKRGTLKKDVTKQMMDIYTTAFAVYIYRTLFVLPSHEHSTGAPSPPLHKVTIVMDVRKGGPHWPNIPAIQFLSFIRHVSTILPFYFPNVCVRCILYGIPAVACTLYQFCIQPILDRNLQRMIQLVSDDHCGGPSHNNTAVSNDDDDATTEREGKRSPGGLYQYLSRDNVQYLEELRAQIIQSPEVSTAKT